jgi:hypothetical protein
MSSASYQPRSFHPPIRLVAPAPPRLPLRRSGLEPRVGWDMKTSGLCASLMAALLACLAENVSAKEEPKSSRVNRSEKPIYDESANVPRQVADAVTVATKDFRHVLLQFGGDWCVPCIRLHNLFESNIDIAATLKTNYVVVHIAYSDASKPLAEQYGAAELGVPFLVILDGQGRYLTTKKTDDFQESDHQSPQKILAFLNEWTPNAVASKSICQWVQELLAIPSRREASNPLLTRQAQARLDQLRNRVGEAIPCFLDAIRNKRPGMSDDTYRDARLRSYEVLVSIAPPSAVPILAEQFISDRELRDVIRAILSELGPKAKAAAPTMIRALRSSEPDLQFRAAWALAHLDPSNPELLPTMMTWLTSSNLFTRRAAPFVLGDLGPAARSALPALMKSSTDPDDVVRKNSIAARSKIEPGAASPTNPDTL